MTLAEKIERSKNRERINFSNIGCNNSNEPLVTLENSDKLCVEPIWTVDFEDHEGGLYKAYIAEHPLYQDIYVRPQIKDMLLLAAQALPDGLKLVVRAGHRPVSVQKLLLAELQEMYQNEHPAATNEAALAHARTFVSDPDVRLPPHCCGAAVDVDVYNTKIDKYMDFGAPVNTDSEISYLYNDLIDETQRANRLILLKTMLSAGFASNPYEWWHYSYGDQNWAWFYQKDKSLYGIIEPKL